MLLYRMRRTIRGVFGLTSTSLTVSAVLCVVIIGINALVWDHMPEPFNGAAALGSAGIDLLLAYVAGYIFYVITSVYPEYKKLHLIYFKVMQAETFDIAKDYADLLSDLALNGKYIDMFSCLEKFGTKGGQPLLVEAAKDLSITSVTDTPPYSTWLDYLTAVNNRERHRIEKMMRFDMEIELDVKLKLVHLLHSDYAQMLDDLNKLSDQSRDRAFSCIIYKLHMHLGALYSLQQHVMNVVVGKLL